MGFFNRKKNDEGQKAPAKAVKADKAKAEAKTEEPKKEVAYVARDTGSAYRVLVRPIVTEKTTMLGKVNQYAFEVAMTANKLEIRKAVKAVYGVEPQEIRVLRFAGKPVRTRAGKSHRSAWRKAIVTLKKGDRIDLFANA